MKADKTPPTAEERVLSAVERDCPHDPQDYEWYYHRSCPKCWAEVVRAAEQAAYQRGMDGAASLLEKIEAMERKYQALYQEKVEVLSEVERLKSHDGPREQLEEALKLEAARTEGRREMLKKAESVAGEICECGGTFCLAHKVINALGDTDAE